ncbi:hydroxyacylglutathione hydrolase [Litoreibacter roseus]|uniref:Hydroxyacylglutathione hydrolase n=1 Tax=Litoreibacter roseus TaxID=2601869 RepID=A0A6N6JD73_9RHOB|nr:hydroxyacylglutathione hydrolase [Litoreibacter roseus]GFE64303.1 hydroxyacylglutathione hydrolase [Litoreibacter roseus]
MLEVRQLPHGPLNNYIALIHDPDTKQTACVDAGEADIVLQELKKTGWPLSQIWVTHHHGDHVNGLQELKSATGATVYGPPNIDGIDQVLGEGDSFAFASRGVSVVHTPGHTTDMLNFHLPSEALFFAGDTLFVMGCGRIMEGTPDMMWDSLQKIMALAADTTIHCAHEYTLANIEFALSVDGDNPKLKSRAAAMKSLRDDGKPTVPTRLSAELDTNPFLRPSDPAIRATLGLETASDAEVFAELRARKDRF